ncbi:MAG: glyceraldehyde 3-phosphate dehydrogenase NAD-binding domain-containing protein, partial [bacterium]|nr:glyceraldehyde 3-phosphate dehydrogenase NAD-binding domain-containing protein [bacterium]
MVKAAVNGFGRIGRIALRIATLKHKDDLQIVAINTPGSMDIEGWA